MKMAAHFHAVSGKDCLESTFTPPILLHRRGLIAYCGNFSLNFCSSLKYSEKVGDYFPWQLRSNPKGNTSGESVLAQQWLRYVELMMVRALFVSLRSIFRNLF
jgi:hypothetical protein